MFGDAAHKLLFNGGLFTPAKAKALFDARLMTINEAIRAESARWGDNGPAPQTSPSPELHLRFSNVDGTYVSWWNERLRILNSVLDGSPNRTTSLIAQLRARGANPSLYPQTSAPVYNQHGGIVPANFSLAMTNPNGSGTIYYTQDGSDPRDVNGLPRAGAATYAGPVTLGTSRVVKARVLHSTLGWSALNEAYFSVGTVAAAAGNLVISKIHYRPGAITDAERDAGFTERSDFEFLEVLNIGANRVSLDGLSFSDGLDITPLPGGTRELDPGERALYVAKKSAFEFRYGTGLPIAGEFSLGSNLGSSETVTLVGANEVPIVTVTYANTAPWPTQPDGFGPALVLMQPATSNPNLASSWRQSTGSGGSPGVDDRLYFAAWQTANFPGGGPNAGALADADGDGLVNLVEFWLGSNPNAHTPASAAPTASTVTLDVGEGPKVYLVFTLRYVKAAEELSWAAESAANLPNWSSSPALIVPIGTPVDHGDGTETRAYRAVNPLDAGGAQFFRARVSTP
jgi:hypothetical protein